MVLGGGLVVEMGGVHRLGPLVQLLVLVARMVPQMVPLGRQKVQRTVVALRMVLPMAQVAQMDRLAQQMVRRMGLPGRQMVLLKVQLEHRKVVRMALLVRRMARVAQKGRLVLPMVLQMARRMAQMVSRKVQRMVLGLRMVARMARAAQ